MTTAVILSAVGAVLMILAATNLQPTWMSPAVAFLAASWFLSSGLVLAEVVRAIRQDRVSDEWRYGEQEKAA